MLWAGIVDHGRLPINAIAYHRPIGDGADASYAARS
jgi:hypothetical protein